MTICYKRQCHLFRDENLELISSIMVNTHIRFWLDQPLLKLLALFSLECLAFPSKNRTQIRIFLCSSWNLHHRRNIRDFEIDELSSLLSIISPLSPSPSLRTLGFDLYPLRVLFLFPLSMPISLLPPLPFHPLFLLKPFCFLCFLPKSKVS